MRRFLITITSGLLLAGTAAAGVVYDIEVTYPDGAAAAQRSESMRAIVDGRQLKVGLADGSEGTRGDLIFRGEQREAIMVDHDDKTYAVIDEETVQAIAGEMSGAMAQIEEALKNVPAEQREMMEKMLKDRMPKSATSAGRPQSELRKTDETDTKNGYPCVKYDVYRDGRRTRELWVTEWKNVEGGDAVVETFNEMAEFFRDISRSFGALAGGAASDNNMFEHMKEINGFPVVTREFADDGSVEALSELRSAKRQTIDPAAFEPPAGYTARNMMR